MDSSHCNDGHLTGIFASSSQTGPCKPLSGILNQRKHLPIRALPFTIKWSFVYDPLDAIVYMNETLVPGSYIRCRIIGALETEDEKGNDTKLILVPSKKVSPQEANIEEIKDLPNMFIEKITYFYQHYKDLEKKEVIIGKLFDKEEAINIYHKTKI